MKNLTVEFIKNNWSYKNNILKSKTIRVGFALWIGGLFKKSDLDIHAVFSLLSDFLYSYKSSSYGLY